ncbi:MAG: hypothetical protein O2780_20715 [Proteobacteria bacterium]|nr:hypothetical protein [Pseudomonadota bacterium]
MTAKRDFKKVVRDRMTHTGETYTQARAAIIDKSLARIDELLDDFRNSGGDRIDREHLIVQAANLATSLASEADVTVLDRAAFQTIYELADESARLDLLEAFLKQPGLTTDDRCWASEDRLILMGVSVKHFSDDEVIHAHEAYFDWVRESCGAEQQTRALINPSLWWRWDNAGREEELYRRMEDCVRSVPAVQDNRQDRMFLARNLLIRAAREGSDADVERFTVLLRGMLEELRGQPDSDDERLGWEGILGQTPVIAAGTDRDKIVIAAERYATWARDSQELGHLGELACLCMLQEHYDLAEQYAQEAIDAGQGLRNALIYAWRAGGHLGATRNVESTVPLLEDARRHLSAKEVTRLLDDQVPFTEFGADPRLRAVIDMHT